MATLLADIMFNECNSSFLRQHTENQFFFLINAYKAAASGVMWPFCGLKMATPGTDISLLMILLICPGASCFLVHRKWRK
jgi:hypothetical protein